MPVFTLSDLRTKALGRLDNNNLLYTLPEVDYVINEAIRTCALFTGFFRNTMQLPGFTVANQLVYPNPTGILVPLFISFEGRQLQKLSFPKLVRTRRSWATDTTASRGRVEFW